MEGSKREGGKMKLWIELYDETKFFGLYDMDNNYELIAVFTYKRGAKNVKRILEEMQGKIQFYINVIDERRSL
jgi:hypothetical protein